MGLDEQLTDQRSIEGIIPHSFQDPKLLTEALTHKSHFNEQKIHSFNERLEFLGDSVLNLAISEMLMARLPLANEGLLSKVRSQLVNETYLSEVARALSLGKFLHLGKGEEKGGGRERSSLLADALEALMGALYLDAGIGKVKLFIEQNFPHFKEADGFNWNDLSKGLADMDYKSRLQEFCQQANLGTPRYECIIEAGANPSEGPFTMILMIQDREIDRMSSRSKKTATQSLAQKFITMESQSLVDLLKAKGLDIGSGRKTSESSPIKDPKKDEI
jgi:ribonuclease-3